MTVESCPTVARFDVVDLHPSRRRQAWADVLYDYYYPLDLHSPPDFETGRLASADIAGIRVATLQSDPMRVHRNASHLAQGGCDFFFLPIPTEGRISLSQRGRTAAVGRDVLAFVATAEAYVYDQPKTAVFRSLRIPGQALRERACSIDDWTAHAFRDDAMARLALDFARSFCDHGIAMETAAGAKVAGHLLDLLALVISGADQSCDETAIRIAHRQRALHLIETHFADPDFCAGRLAHALKLSDRYLQKIFAEHGETVSGAIRRRRIAEACRLLANRQTSRASVSSIAYAVGFLDPAYFSRVFRKETGGSPVRHSGA